MNLYKFEIKPLNTEKIINLILKKYKLFNITKNNKKCCMCCYIRDKNSILNILKQNNVDILNADYYSYNKYFNNLFKVGIILGIIVSCIFWICSTFFVTKVTILGNINFTKDQILNVLKNQNIKSFCLKSKINTKQLEQNLLKIKYVSYASCIVKGNTLILNIKEQLTNNEVVNIGNFEPIVSTFDGIVKSVNLVQGTLKVKVGDIVKTGDVLVSPYVVKNEKTLSVQPLADIVCDVWYTQTLEVKDVEYKKVETGKSIKTYSLKFLDKPIYVKNKTNNFKDYLVKTKEFYVSKCLIPIKMTTKTYYELKTIKVENNFKQNKQKFVSKIRQMSLRNIQKYDIIKDESCSVTRTKNSNILTYTITINKKVC